MGLLKIMCVVFREVQEGPKVFLEACSSRIPGAFPATLDCLQDAGKASAVRLQPMTKRDVMKAAIKAQPTVAEDELLYYQCFTEEFGM